MLGLCLGFEANMVGLVLEDCGLGFDLVYVALAWCGNPKPSCSWHIVCLTKVLLSQLSMHRPLTAVNGVKV